MSYFNADQDDYMRSLADLPDEKVSWCGWGPAGDKWCCMNPDCIGKRTGKTLADRKAEKRASEQASTDGEKK